LKLSLDLSAELRPLLEAGLPGLLPPAKELLRFGDFNFFFQKHKVITIIIIVMGHFDWPFTKKFKCS
jgi:hypothetical protein